MPKTQSARRWIQRGLGLGLCGLLVLGVIGWYRGYTSAPLLLIWDHAPTTVVIEVAQTQLSPITQLQVWGDGRMNWNSRQTGPHETQLSAAQMQALLQQINFRTPQLSPFSDISTPLDRAATLRVNLIGWQRECIVFWNWQTHPQWRCGGLYAALLTLTGEAP